MNLPQITLDDTVLTVNSGAKKKKKGYAYGWRVVILQ